MSVMRDFRPVPTPALFALLAATAVFAGEKTVQRETNLRGGPGAYYEVVLPLPHGTRVETGESRGAWLAGRVDSSKGWVASSAFDKASFGIDYSGTVARSDITVISSVDIAAGTKGAFLTAYSEKHDLNPVVASTIDAYSIDPATVNAMKKDLRPLVISLAGKLPSKKYENSIVLRPDAEALLGQALVAHVAKNGFIDDPGLNAYVNSVAAIVGEQTERYDLQYKVGIMNDPNINGFGLPGGYILISKGLLDSVRTESELACLLGHEMAHISLFHGLREFQKRETHRKSDSAFAELEGLTGGGDRDDIENDLNKIADKAYLKIIGERARGDESEADLFGAAYAASAGYNPGSMINVLQRIHNDNPSSDTFRHHPPISRRAADLQDAISRFRMKAGGGLELADRFRDRVAPVPGN